MRILAIDTALEACSTALVDTDLGGILGYETQVLQRGHAEALMPMIKRTLDRTRIDVAAIDRIAVTVGPGSFTGLRVGIAAARGMALAMGKPAIGISTLASYAAPLIAQDDSIPVLAVIDARHSHVYLQMFGPGGHTLMAPQLASIVKAQRVGSTNDTIRIVGSAAKVIAAAWPETHKPPIVEQRDAPDITWVARLGVAALDTGAPPKPLYLRAPDAQPQSAARLGR
jgi:tRNA threonylcarbamoyladenosine biosynthesis protein TsaB